MTSKSNFRGTGALAGAACLPVFVGPAAPFVSIPGIFGSAQPIHWSLLAAPILFLTTSKLPTSRSKSVFQSGFTLLLWLLVALVIGQLISPSSGLLAFSFFIQLLVPSLMVVVGCRLANQSEAWTSTLNAFLKGLTAFQVAFLFLNFSSLFSGDIRTVATIFPQYQTYYPGLLALGACVAVYTWPRNRLWAVAYGATLLVLAPAIWSRIGLVAILLAIMSSLIVRSRTGGTKTPTAGKALGWMMGSLAALVGAYFFVREALSGTIGDRLESKGGNVLESGRQELMLQAIRKIFDRPLLGDAGQALYDRADFGGTGGLGLRLFPAHSQYLDLGIRGGLPAMILGALLVGALITSAWRAYKRREDGLHRLLPPVAAVMIAAAASDLYFSQALTATPGWLLLGLGLGGLAAGQQVVDVSVDDRSARAR